MTPPPALTPVQPLDPRRWLLICQGGAADRAAAHRYAERRGLLRSHVIPLLDPLPDPTLDAAGYDSLRLVLNALLDRIGPDRIDGLILGFGMPHAVDLGGPVRSLASLLAQPGSPIADQANPLHAPAVARVAELPDRATLRHTLGAPRLLVGDLAAPTLELADALPDRADAWARLAAGGELVSRFDGAVDRIAIDVDHADVAWPSLHAWRDSLAAERIGLPRPPAHELVADPGEHPLDQAIVFTHAAQPGDAWTDADPRRAMLMSLAADLIHPALNAGFAAVAAPLDAADPAAHPDPMTLLTALDAGASLAEAFALASPTLGSPWRLLGDPFATLPAPRRTVALYRADQSDPIALMPDHSGHTLPIAGRLPVDNQPRTWRLQLRRCDEFSLLSDPAELAVVVEPDGAIHPAWPELATERPRPLRDDQTLLAFAVVGRDTITDRFELAGPDHAPFATIPSRRPARRHVVQLPTAQLPGAFFVRPRDPLDRAGPWTAFPPGPARHGVPTPPTLISSP